MIDSLNTLKRQSIPKFYVSLVLSTLLSEAAAAPFIEWVSPPVWLETRAGNEPAQAGTSITSQTWITTGRGGSVMVRLASEQVEIDENSMWEWQGQDNGSTGNALQGRVRMGARVQTAESKLNAPGVTRLYFNAPWTLVLNAGDEEANAQRLVLFLRKSGYPLQETKYKQADGTASWHLLVAGFLSNEAAMIMGKQLMALAPGIVSASYQRNPTSDADTGIALKFSAPPVRPYDSTTYAPIR